MYPVNCGVWDAIGERIHIFIKNKLGLSDEAALNLRMRLREQYKTTMQGLHVEFGIDEQEYLQFVHDIQLTSLVPPNPDLPALLAAIPQKKYIFTNSTRYHAGRILHHLNVHDYFEDIIDVSMINPYTKFERAAFPIALRLIGNPPPGECVMVDDEEEIIERALEEGLQGILVNQNPQQNGHNHVQIPSINHLDRALLQLSEKYSSSHQNEI
jgi:putative hydrolase of the HAD superfamily